MFCFLFFVVLGVDIFFCFVFCFFGGGGGGEDTFSPHSEKRGGRRRGEWRTENKSKKSPNYENPQKHNFISNMAALIHIYTHRHTHTAGEQHTDTHTLQVSSTVLKESRFAGLLIHCGMSQLPGCGPDARRGSFLSVCQPSALIIHCHIPGA